MTNENMTHDDYANMIAESWINGQKKQAIEQFRRAVNDYCNPAALLQTLHDVLSMVDYHALTQRLIVEAYAIGSV